MSIESEFNYMPQSFTDIRPEWQKLERLDYCDQDTKTSNRGIFRLFKTLLGLAA